MAASAAFYVSMAERSARKVARKKERAAHRKINSMIDGDGAELAGPSYIERQIMRALRRPVDVVVSYEDRRGVTREGVLERPSDSNSAPAYPTWRDATGKPDWNAMQAPFPGEPTPGSSGSDRYALVRDIREPEAWEEYARRAALAVASAEIAA